MEGGSEYQNAEPGHQSREGGAEREYQAGTPEWSEMEGSNQDLGEWVQQGFLQDLREGLQQGHQ